MNSGFGLHSFASSTSETGGGRSNFNSLNAVNKEGVTTLCCVERRLQLNHKFACFLPPQAQMGMKLAKVFVTVATILSQSEVRVAQHNRCKAKRRSHDSYSGTRKLCSEAISA